MPKNALRPPSMRRILQRSAYASDVRSKLRSDEVDLGGVLCLLDRASMICPTCAGAKTIENGVEQLSVLTIV